MAETSDDTAGRLTADALQLAISLDSFTTFDLAERIEPVFQHGYQQLKELKQRHESLLVSRADEATLGWILETIQCASKFPGTPQCRNVPPEPRKKSPGSLKTGVVSAETLVAHLTLLVHVSFCGHAVNYSYLSAIIGSSRMARRAGI